MRGSALENLKGAKSRAKALDFALLESLDSARTQNITLRIKVNEPYDEEHLCALKLYTDFNDLCAAFCAILRRGDPKEIAQIANWTKKLTETVQCFGSSLSGDKMYYRGVKRTFMFITIVSRFNLPMSTTSSVKYRQCLHFTETSRRFSFFSALLRCARLTNTRGARAHVAASERVIFC